MTEEYILELVREYKANVLDRLSDQRRKQGISAYLPAEMQRNITDGKLSMDTAQIKAGVIQGNIQAKHNLYGRIQTNDYDAVMPLAKKMAEDAGDTDNIQLLCDIS